MKGSTGPPHAVRLYMPSHRCFLSSVASCFEFRRLICQQLACTELRVATPQPRRPRCAIPSRGPGGRKYFESVLTIFTSSARGFHANSPRSRAPNTQLRMTGFRSLAVVAMTTGVAAASRALDATAISYDGLRDTFPQVQHAIRQRCGRSGFKLAGYALKLSICCWWSLKEEAAWPAGRKGAGV